MLFRSIIGNDIENSQRSDGETYSMVDFNGFSRFEWRPWPTKQTSNIFLSLYGDSLSNGILNDSMATPHHTVALFAMGNSQTGHGLDHL